MADNATSFDEIAPAPCLRCEDAARGIFSSHPHTCDGSPDDGTEAFRRCPACGHDWSGHVDPPLPFMACEGKNGLRYVSGCRCTVTLRRAVVAALIATGRHTSETAHRAIGDATERLAEYDARVRTSPVQVQP